MSLNSKERELLKTIGLHITEKLDYSFNKSWLDSWSMGEVYLLDQELLQYCKEDEEDSPDFFILCIPITVTFKFLLHKLTNHE